MEKQLQLYRKADFYKLKALKDNVGTSIISITKYINELSLIESHSFADIVDISALTEFNNKQSIAEQVVYRFNDVVDFICEETKWRELEYEVRYLFGNLEASLTYAYEPEEDATVPIDTPSAGKKKRVVWLYEKEAFQALDGLVNDKGYIIESLSKMLDQRELVDTFDSKTTIIDISGVAEYSRLQTLTEDAVYRLPLDTIYIADHSKLEKIEYDLRLIFKSFKPIQENEFFNHSTLTSNPGSSYKPTKKHRLITDLNDNELNHFFSNLKHKLYGHPKFKDDFEEHVRTFRVFNRLGEHKILSIFLMGESGVGKTEVARLIFDCLHGKKSLAKINFGNYSNEFSLSSLIGSARGYIGSEDGEIFMKVRDTDVGVLLIDEFEKSNATLFNYFLDVLESGKMTSSLGHEIDLNGFIIVFTSNISKENYKARISPELRSRFDFKCMFTVIGTADKMKYVQFRTNTILNKLKPDDAEAFGEDLSSYLQSSIDVTKYNNMRDINKKIKKEFVHYLTTTNVHNNDEIIE